jgi:hypothetical protein
MSWESRTRGGRYYTRSRRVHGRIVREYLGTGPVAEAAAEHDHLARTKREWERSETHRERVAIDRREAPVKALHDDIELLTRGALLAAGYHRHHGDWRRKHVV